MLISNKIISFLFILVSVCGCASTQTGQAQDVKEVQSALGAVAGENVTEEDLRNLAQQIQKDPEAQGAIEAISDTLANESEIKYCPVTGKRYSPKMSECPVHKVELKLVSE